MHQIRSFSCASILFLKSGPWAGSLGWSGILTRHRVHPHLVCISVSAIMTQLIIVQVQYMWNFKQLWLFSLHFVKSQFYLYLAQNTKRNSIRRVNLSFNCVFWRWKGRSRSVSIMVLSAAPSALWNCMRNVASAVWYGAVRCCFSQCWQKNDQTEHRRLFW